MDVLKIFEAIKTAKELVLATHINPDIDGISSMLAFSLYLNSIGRKNYPLIENFPHNIDALKGTEFLKLPEEVGVFDPDSVVMVFDAGSPDRIPPAVLEKLGLCKKFIIIDHHQIEKDRKSFSEKELLFIDPSAPSTTFLIFKMFKKADITITPDIAHNLLAGLYYDTGGFRYENTKDETFFVAAELCRSGANPSLIAKKIFENIPLEEIEALKIILNRLELLNSGKIAISYLKHEDFERLGSKDVGNLSNFLRSIKGVKVSALVKEVEPCTINVSLRSESPVEVVDFARSFGGGGHKYASGFRLKVKDFEKFLNSFKEALKEFYAEI